MEKLAERFNASGGPPTFRHLEEVTSELEQYQCLQVCDLLLGCVLNNLKPTKKTFKNKIRQYLCERLEVRSFLLTTWKDVPMEIARSPETKFNVWFWGAEKRPRRSTRVLPVVEHDSTPPRVTQAH